MMPCLCPARGARSLAGSLVSVSVLLAAGFALACSTEDDSVIYVDSKATGALADGSREAPFKKVSEALSHARAGSRIVVRPGSYVDEIALDLSRRNVAPLTIERDPGDQTDEIVEILPREGQPGVRIDDPGGGVPERVTLRGLVVSGASVAGIAITGAAVDVVDCVVEKTRKVTLEAGAAPVYGFGILASGGARLRVSGGTVDRNDGQGLLARDSTVSIAGTRLTDNGADGIRLERCTSGLVDGCHLEGNAVAGIALLSSDATVQASQVLGTRRDSSIAGYGDGIVVAELVDGGKAQGPSSVEIVENLVEGSGRIGILLSDGSQGRVAGNQVRSSSRGGLWIQGSAGQGTSDGIRAEGNQLEKNTFCGANLTAGARATLTDNRVEGTVSGLNVIDATTSERVNHGVAVFSDAFVRLQGNVFGPLAQEDGTRSSHILIEGAATGTGLLDNLPEGTMDPSPVAPLRIVLQHQPEDRPLDPPTAEEIGARNGNTSPIVVPMTAPLEYPAGPRMRGGFTPDEVGVVGTQDTM